LLDKYQGNIAGALNEYSRIRNPDAEAICDLAVQNYVEMRHNVVSWSYLLKKKVEWVLGTLFPKSFIPLYTMVSFTEIPYSEVMRRAQSQDAWLAFSARFLVGSSLLAAAFGALVRFRPVIEEYVKSL